MKALNGKNSITAQNSQKNYMREFDIITSFINIIFDEAKIWQFGN
jgi:hypothetical protein